MSALGHKQTFASQQVMSALRLKADTCGALAHVCFGPIADMAPVIREPRQPPKESHSVYSRQVLWRF
jgi:hypothetical protein